MSFDRSNRMTDENIGHGPAAWTNPNAPRSMLTVVAVAKRPGVSPSKVRQLAAARQIAHFRVGVKIVFRKRTSGPI